MVIENMMYFALGLLVAGLVALIILPAVWKRAVRLTKRRIEAAIPITMAEFRADKDQLRAEFALSTRRLEMTVDTLRQRLAEQMSAFNQKRSDFGQMQAERDQHQAVVAELEARLEQLRGRVAELEREGTDLAQRLRMRDREFEAREAELLHLRAARAGETGGDAAAADSLVAAEASIASAENRLNALLAETGTTAATSPGAAGPSLAAELSLDADLAGLRQQVGAVEAAILSDWGSGRADPAALRQRLGDIAAGISRLVYAADTEAAPAAEPEESLFERVQRFADDGEARALPPADSTRQRGSVTDRMTALREIQGR